MRATTVHAPALATTPGIEFVGARVLFADAIQTGRVPTLDVSRGLHVQRVVEAADTELLLHR